MVSRTANARTAALAAITVAASLLVSMAASSPASADDSFPSMEVPTEYVDLPLTTVRTTLLDAAHHQVFVAGAADDDSLLVLSPGGETLHQVALRGVVQMALDEDASHVYAAVPTAHEIAVIDTTTYAVTVHPTPDTCPEDVAPFGDEVWFAGGCSEQFDTLQVLDLDTDATHLAFPDYPDGWYYQPALNRVPGTDQLLVGSENTDLIDTATSTLVARSDSLQAGTNDVEFAPDGSSVFAFHSGETISLPDLTLQPIVTSYGGVPPDGGDADLVFTQHQDVSVYDRSSTELVNVVRLIEYSPGGGHRIDVKRTVLADGILDIFAQYDVGGTPHARLFLDRTPGTPAPRLTATATAAAATHPVTISGTLTDAGEPVAGELLTVRDDSEGTDLGTTTTQADGTWSFTRTWDEAGTHLVSVESPVDGPRKTALTYTWVNVHRRAVDLTLDGPSTADPNQTVHMTGTMTIEGAPAADQKVGWFLYCFQGESLGTPNRGTVTTDASGHYSFDADPGRCADVEVNAYHDRDDSTESVGLDTRIDVGWHVYEVHLRQAQPIYAGSHYDTQALVTLDGKPAPGVPVALTIHPSSHIGQDLTETTDDSGQVPISFDTPWVDTYYVEAEVQGTPTTLGDDDFQNLQAAGMPTSLTVQTDVDHTTVGQTVTVSGTLTHPQGGSGGETVTLFARDLPAGVERSATTVVAPNGHYGFEDVPQAGGTTTYVVGFNGTSTQAAADSVSTTVDVAKLANTPTLTFDQRVYDPGNVAHVHVDLGYAGAFTLTGTIAGTPHVIYDGSTDSDGRDIDLPMTYTETFQVIAAGDNAHTAATSASTTRRVRMLLRAYPTDRRKPAEFLQHRRARLSAQETPARPGTCLRFAFQRHTSSGWRALGKPECRTANVYGTATYRFTHRHRLGVVYRYRATFAGDDRNLTAHTQWVRFRFVRRS